MQILKDSNMIKKHLLILSAFIICGAITIICYLFGISGYLLGIPMIPPLFLLMWCYWPGIVSAIIIITSFFNTMFLYINISGLNLKPENIGALLAILATSLKLINKHERLLIRFPGYCILGWVFVTAVSSLYSLNPVRTLTLTFSILLGTLSFFIIINVIRDFQSFELAFKILMIAGVLEGIFGIISWILSQNNPGIMWTYIDPTGYLAVRGTWMETNIFGMFLIPTIALLISPLILKKNTIMVSAGIIICLFGIVISRTRGAWLALVICIPLIPILLSAMKIMRLSRYFYRSILIIMLVSLIFIPVITIALRETGTTEYLLNLLLSFNNLTGESSFNMRIDIMSTAIKSFFTSGSILFGRGAKGFSLAGFNIMGIGDDWIGNIFVAALYDSGIIGLFLFCLSIFFPLINGIVKTRRLTNTKIKIYIFSLILACSANVLSGQVNNHSWLSMFWVYYGMLVAGISLIKKKTVIGL